MGEVLVISRGKFRDILLHRGICMTKEMKQSLLTRNGQRVTSIKLKQTDFREI